jgi:AraC-like DNA-binding protein
MSIAHLLDQWERSQILIAYVGHHTHPQAAARLDYFRGTRDHYQIYVVRAGICTVQASRYEVTIPAGAMALLPCMDSHTERWRSDGRATPEMYVIAFRTLHAYAACDPIHLLGLPYVTKTDPRLSCWCASYLSNFDSWKKPSLCFERLRAQSALSMLLIETSVKAVTRGEMNLLKQIGAPDWVHALAARLRGREMQGAITVDLMAQWTGYSASYVRQQFTRYFGKSPTQYLFEERMKEAQRLLRSNPQYSIAQTAGRVGYNSPAYFSKDFKGYTGVTPRQWRRSSPTTGAVTR